jgi:hypothetical protein
VNESLEDVRRDIENIRSAIGEKIEKIEDKIETTKNTTLNPTYYLKTHPWPILGGIALLSCLAGRSLRFKRSEIIPPPAGNGLVGSAIGSVASTLLNAAAVVAANYFRDRLAERRDHRDDC